MKTIKSIAYGLFLGGVLVALADINFMNWKFYAIIIPTAILVEWKSAR